MKVYYHNRDLDGFSSAAIVKLAHPDAEFIGYDYGMPFEVPEGEEVIMVDVSLPMHIMNEIGAKSSGFTWIDHHVSAINEFNEYYKNRIPPINAVLDTSFAACQLTWMHFFPEKPIPVTIDFLGDYDIWQNQDLNHWNETILPFQFGMRLECNSLETFPMHLLHYGPDGFPTLHIYDIDRSIGLIVSKGKLVLQYQSSVNEVQCKKSFVKEFEGLRALFLNGGGFNSDVFKSVYNPEVHDVMMPFQFNGKFWTFSIYTTKDEIDCSVLAKRHGGGGHKKAAGFQVDNLIDILSI